MNEKLSNYFIEDKSLVFLKKYLDATSPSGYEVEGQKIWKNYIKKYVDEINTDIYGNVVAIINNNSNYKVVIEAHADEISWCVNYINEDGFIYVIRNGGSDHMIAASKRIYIHTEKGLVPGVFGWQAIHTRKLSDDKVPKVEDLYIDIGASSKKEVETLGVHVGCMITYIDNFSIINNKYFLARGLDNRIGGFIIAEVAKLIKKEKYSIPFSLYIVNAVQEEVGLRGAEMITQNIRPNIAIVTDVCHDTYIPMIDKKNQGDIRCGLGPVISYAPSVQNKLRDFIINIAIKNEIKFQRLASYRYTGTDTDAFAYSNGGVASALISIPLKYMHTTVEMAHKNDIEKTILLIYQLIKNIEINHDLNYFS